MKATILISIDTSPVADNNQQKTSEIVSTENKPDYYTVERTVMENRLALKMPAYRPICKKPEPVSSNGTRVNFVI